MEITIDLKTIKIIVHFRKFNSYAVLVPKFGEPIKMTIPELIKALRMVQNDRL